MWRKRGRPAKSDVQDFATAELQMKKALRLTADPLDFALHHRIISINEHKSGMRLRWLFAIQFGNMKLRGQHSINAYSISSSAIGQESSFVDKGRVRRDHEWLSERKREYDTIMFELSRYRVSRFVVDICIYGERPAFLYSNIISNMTMNSHSTSKGSDRKKNVLHDRAREAFCSGMSLLSSLFEVSQSSLLLH